MKIYTRTGDRMTTGLLDGARVSKNDMRIHLLGNIDELNSQLGVVKSLTANMAQKEELSGIQRMLMRIMSGIADASQSGSYQVDEASTAHLEAEIDRMESAFERIKDFVLPGGSFYSAQIDVARTVTRRCERWFAGAAEEYPMDTEAARYLNRLSDYLYVLARYVDAADQDQTKNVIATLTAERAQKAVNQLHKQINHSCGTFYTLCVCDAEGRQLATNARAHYSVAVFEAKRSATNALRRAARAAMGTGEDAASGQAIEPELAAASGQAIKPELAAAPGRRSAPGQSVISVQTSGSAQPLISGSVTAPEDGGAAFYIQGRLIGSVGVYGSYRKDMNEKAQMLVDLLCLF